MLEIVYRIYEVAENAEDVKCNTFGMSSLSKSCSYEVAMDVCICESRDKFKDIIKDAYGKDIKFAYSRKYAPGTVYCIIIGEHCYDTEKYFMRREFMCPQCKNKIVGNLSPTIHLAPYEIKTQLCNQIDKYQNLHFCSLRCKEMFIESEKQNLTDNNELGGWITRDSYDNSVCAGYIYLITKKSTGQFYVGQTVYVPVFRWGEHLKTARFPLDNIEDYVFEVLEVVPKHVNILEREKYWIQTMYKSAPELSLNIACTKNISDDT